MSTDGPSSLVQGVVVSTFLRLTQGRPAVRERRLLERAYERLAASVEGGGTCSRIPEGPFLEECPDGPPRHILNGCIYALFGLYDLAETTGHRGATRLASSLEATLAGSLQRFDTRLGWSRYCLDLAGVQPLSGVPYQRLHIEMLRILHARTGSNVFRDYANRWERSLYSTWVRLPNAALKTAQVVWLRDILRVRLPEIAPSLGEHRTYSKDA
jgi:hypothetical protein